MISSASNSSARAAFSAAAIAIALLAGTAFIGRAGAQEASKKSPVGYVEMPISTDNAFTLVAGIGSDRHWGKPETIRFLVFAAREWARRHPKKPRFHIGDMSKPDGAPFPPHKTHRDGLTMDLFTRPKNVCHKDYPDQGLTRELAELLVQLGARQILYNGQQVVDAVPVAKAWPNHDDHFHIVIDPRRVPKDLGPLLVAPTSRKDGGSLGPTAFGKPSKRRRRPKIDVQQNDLMRRDLRIEWDFLGESRGFQKTARVQVEVLADGGFEYDSGPLDTKKRYHLVDTAFSHGTRLRWRVDVADRKGATQTTGWHTVTIDFKPPVVATKAPSGDRRAGSKPKFSWTFLDASKQAWARVEVRKLRRRRGTSFGEVRGNTTELQSIVELPRRAKREWRVVVADQAGNEATSDWTLFKIE